MKNQKFHTYLLGASSLLVIVALSITFSGITQNNRCDNYLIDINQEPSKSECANANVPNQVKLVDTGHHCSIKNDNNTAIAKNQSPETAFTKVKSSDITTSYSVDHQSVKHHKANSSLNVMLETYSIRKLEGQTRNGMNITGFEFTVETFQGSIQHLPASPFSVESNEPATSLSSAPVREISRWNLIERWRAFKRSV